MKLVADDKIPHVSDFFTPCDEIVYLPGEMITHKDLHDADILLTRTVTRVDANLLANTSVRLVGTATTGTDHIDEIWLAKQHISLATAAGANSTAVAEYVVTCLAALKTQGLLQNKKVAGVIGCGRIGRIVASIFQTLGYEVICYDPLLTEKLDFNFVSLDVLMRESDLISIHTPLTKNGHHPTFHLIDDEQLKKIKSNVILINTSRGGVIDQHALLSIKNIILCLDVWENEPHISLELLHKVIIGTPHIAGYSLQAKYRATQMLYEYAAEFFGWEKMVVQEETASMDRLLVPTYDPLEHTKQFRDAFRNQTDPEVIQKIFTTERKKYPLRNESRIILE